jgi:hypothetical protein
MTTASKKIGGTKMPDKINLTIVLIIMAVAGLVMAAPAQVQGVVFEKRR